MTLRRLATACCFVFLMSGLALAQELKIALVDVELIQEKYDELNKRQEELRIYKNEKEAFITALQDYMFLSQEEFAEVARIYQNPANQWTEAQKLREAELRKISEDNERKFRDLQAKPSRTPEEQNQYSTLRDTFQARDAELREIMRTFNEELARRAGEIQQQLVGSVRGVIAEYAQANGYTLVIDKSAAFFSAAPVIDVTGEIVAALNQGAAPPAGEGNGGGTE